MTLRRSAEWAAMPDKVKQDAGMQIKEDGEFWSVSRACFVVGFTPFRQSDYAIYQVRLYAWLCISKMTEVVMEIFPRSWAHHWRI